MSDKSTDPRYGSIIAPNQYQLIPENADGEGVVEIFEDTNHIELHAIDRFDHGPVRMGPEEALEVAHQLFAWAKGKTMSKSDHDKRMIAVCDDMLFGIEQEGFHYYLKDYTSPDYVAKRAGLEPHMLDPRLRGMWEEYLELEKRIVDYLETAGGRREERPPEG